MQKKQNVHNIQVCINGKLETDLEINNEKIEQVDDIKYLGIIVTDNKLWTLRRIQIIFVKRLQKKKS